MGTRLGQPGTKEGGRAGNKPADKRQADKGKGVWHGDKGKEGGGTGTRRQGEGVWHGGKRVGPVDYSVFVQFCIQHIT